MGHEHSQTKNIKSHSFLLIQPHQSVSPNHLVSIWNNKRIGNAENLMNYSINNILEFENLISVEDFENLKEVSNKIEFIDGKLVRT